MPPFPGEMEIIIPALQLRQESCGSQSVVSRPAAWELVKHANSVAPLQVHGIRNSGMQPGTLCLMHAQA